MSIQSSLTFSKAAESIKENSIYEHYKGYRYKVISVALHTETLEELVIYQALYGDFKIWVRPLFMFLENVNIENEIKPRFKLLT
jgi:hypothetical protein